MSAVLDFLQSYFSQGTDALAPTEAQKNEVLDRWIVKGERLVTVAKETGIKKGTIKQWALRRRRQGKLHGSVGRPGLLDQQSIAVLTLFKQRNPGYTEEDMKGEISREFDLSYRRKNPNPPTVQDKPYKMPARSLRLNILKHMGPTHVPTLPPAAVTSTRAGQSAAVAAVVDAYAAHSTSATI